MSHISQEKINEIRLKADIVSIISNYVSLTPRGKNYFGVCPFHDDNNPSMSVNGEKKIYKCFSCGATGTVFRFIMDYENVSFMEAIQKVAETVGINVDIGQVNKVYKNSSLYDIYDLSLKFYINNINSVKGRDAKSYLKSRDIDNKIIKEFGIGLSFDNNDLTKLLFKKFKEDDILKTGLVNKGNFNVYDVYHNRIMFPLWDLDGKVVGYSGRIYNTADSAKYINTKETEIFKKGEIIYNYHRAKRKARLKNKIIVMEGFMDVIRAYTISYENVIAVMGTAVTKRQANLIKKMAKDVILCFDGDSAGAKATMSCADELISIGVTPKVVRLPDNLDPDDYIRKYGKEKFDNLIEHPLNIMDFKLNYLKHDKNMNNSVDEANYVNEAIKEISKIDDDILREITIKKLALETNLDYDLIKGKIEDKPKKKLFTKKKHKIDKYIKAQRNLIFYMLRSGDVIKMYNNKVTYMPDRDYRFLAREISNFYKTNGFIDEADFMDYMQCDDELINCLVKVSDARLKENYSVDEINDYIHVIQDYNIKNETKRLQEIMKNEVDPLKKAKIAQNIVDLKKEWNNDY